MLAYADLFGITRSATYEEETVLLRSEEAGEASDLVLLARLEDHDL
jgi:hypothetical protein